MTVAGRAGGGHSERMFGDGNGSTGRRLGREPPRQPAQACGCAWPGCGEAGLYPAPEGRHRLRSFRWLCLEHVRAFNLGWDYFAGMSREEVEAHQRADVTWHRPTWRFGTRAGEPGGPRVHDPFGFFDDHGEMSQPARPAGTVARMMAVLDLEVGFTLDQLKRRYKTLAKQHHPDLQGGDRAAEERLKSIIEAYRYLLDHRVYA